MTVTFIKSCKMSVKFLVIILLISVYVTEVFLKNCQPLITVIEGSMTGKQFTTNKKTPFYAFLDIPYAEPPIGKTRFQESHPIKKWFKHLDATANKKVCVQYDPTFTDPRETEDCLVLNVYVPAETFCNRKKASLPVLIWIHGGSFRSWFGTMDTFGPQYFLDKQLIVVTLNYRLGPLGFLSTGDNVIPGNLGIKDQELAIKWVSKRIRSFGGNPTRVTLMGQSAGAICVGYHLMNLRNKGLFSAAIMHSASPLSCAALQKYPRDAAYLMAAKIDQGFQKTNTSEELLKLLQNASLDELKNGSFIELPENKLNCQRFSSLTWVPTKESNEAKNPIITGMNYEKIKKRLMLNVPLLIGINSQESLYYGTTGLKLLAALYDVNPAYMINGNLNIESIKKNPAGKALKELYTNSTFSSNISNLADFNSDNYFDVPTITYAYYHATHSNVYAYRFAFKGLLGELNSSLPGVGHGEDLNYFFQNSLNENLLQFSEEELLTHERVIELWSQFIKYRDPTKYSNEVVKGVHWPKYTQKMHNYLNIDKNLTVNVFSGIFKEWISTFDMFARPQLDTF